MGRMDEEQALFEDLSLRDFKDRSFTAIKTFNNSATIMGNNSDKIRIS